VGEYVDAIAVTKVDVPLVMKSVRFLSKAVAPTASSTHTLRRKMWVPGVADKLARSEQVDMPRPGMMNLQIADL